MRIRKFWVTVLGMLLAAGLSTGFKLEKDPIQMTQTDARKANVDGEEKKIKEGPASPSFKMDSFDDFMTGSPLRKSKESKESKSSSKKVKRKIK